MSSAPSPPAAPGVRGRRPSPGIAQLRRTLYFFSRNTLAMVGLGILLFFVALALYSPFYPASATQLPNYCGTYPVSTTCAGTTVCTYAQGTSAMPGCYAVDPSNPSFVPPTFNFAHFSPGPLPLGSLSVVANGQNFYSISDGIIKGSAWSLGVSGGIVAAGAGIGLLLGAIAGYKGGMVDEVLMRLTDIFLSIPALLFVLVLIAALATHFQGFTQRIGLLMLAFIAVWWPLYTRIVRGQVLVTREQKYVEASRASGASTGRILFRHIIPNSVYPIFVQMSLDVGAIPLLLGALIFLGFPIWSTPYFPEWGTLSALAVIPIPGELQYCNVVTASGGTCLFPWWQLIFPGMTVFLFAIAVNFLSDGLRDALDPRLRR